MCHVPNMPIPPPLGDVGMKKVVSGFCFGSLKQGCDLRHYSLFSLMSSKLTLFTLFLIFETLFIIFVKFRHYLYQVDIICLNWFKIGTKWVNWSKIGWNVKKWVKIGQIPSFVANHVMSRLRAFLDIILWKYTLFSNIIHYFFKY